MVVLSLIDDILCFMAYLGYQADWYIPWYARGVYARG